ncbi:signal peptidase I [Halobellus rubicundus]|uniref:Signal peptidase I n=1 Tax=Halobellus rubicundus TaxID=2996466 RepID=A0ABD5MD98_9EURY
MTPRRAAEYALVGVLLLVIGSLVLGQAIGQPVLFSYVETGSMEPMLRPNDGFVAIPMAVAGPVRTGDVIVFDAVNLNGGDLVTHRVVGETDGGYITKGDANPVTDQDSAEPPVQDAQIVAKALQVGGRIVVVPQLGVVVVTINDGLSGVQRSLATLFGTRALLGSQGLAYILFGFGIVTYVLTDLLGRKSGPTRTRRTSRSGIDDGRAMGRIYVLALTVCLLILVTGSMTVPAGPQSFDIVSSSQDAPGIRVVASGTSETVRYLVPSNGLLPVVVFLEPATEGIAAQPSMVYVPSNSVRESIVTVTAPPSTGYYQRTLVEHRYLAVLPTSTIEALYRIHPWLPIVAIDALLGAGVASLGLSTLYGARRVRSRDLPLRERLYRFFK